MELGTVLLIMLGVLLVLSILVKEWARAEQKKYDQTVKKRRRIFRKR